MPPLSSASRRGNGVDPNSHILFSRHEELVAIVEPRGFLRECIVRYLAVYCGASVGGCSSIEDLVADNSERPLDLVVLSAANKTQLSTLNEVGGLRDGGIACPIIVLVDICEPAFTHEALRHGVRGVVPATVSGDVAVEAIRLVLAGGTYIPTEALMTLARAQQQPANSSHNHLTVREEQILALLRHGKQNKQIAYELSLSEGTVKVHVHNIMRKFGVSNRTQILAAAK
jgi:DNA-binding NarL/FixJ family response regulator